MHLIVIEAILSFSPWLPPLRESAYLDPGSGSFLLQLLIAGLVGAAFVIKGYWGKIKSFFSRSTPEQDDGSEDE
jgi:hypothetical protein